MEAYNHLFANSSSAGLGGIVWPGQTLLNVTMAFLSAPNPPLERPGNHDLCDEYTLGAVEYNENIHVPRRRALLNSKDGDFELLISL